MKIVVSMLGTTLDQHGKGARRWDVWRPSVALAMHENLPFDRYYLLYPKKYEKLKDEIAADIRQVSPETEVSPVEFKCEDPCDFESVYAELFDFSRALAPKPDENEYFIHITTGTHVAQICLYLLTESRHLPGKLIQTQPDTQRGDPAGSYAVIDLDLSRYDRLAKRFDAERRDNVSFLKSGIPTRNAAFNALIDKIERVAIHSRQPILLTGPTGSGKSQIARRIYELKKANSQVGGAFVDVNCATLRGDAAMSALFGHRKGAFTGAASDRPGLLKTADGGVLFLDEVGELGAGEQAMLLRAIEEKRFLPLGSDKEERSDFQLICGTNRDLGEAVAAGRFREGLLSRINLWSFAMPGLADRREDIEPNLDYELEQFARATGRRITFNREARERFLRWACDPATSWRGNFRELNAMMTRLATLAPGGRIGEASVEAEIENAQSGAVPGAGETNDVALARLLGAGYAKRFDRFDLVQLKEVLRVCSASKSLADAARSLFAVSRLAKKTANDSDRLAKYLRRFGIDAGALREAGG